MLRVRVISIFAPILVIGLLSGFHILADDEDRGGEWSGLTVSDWEVPLTSVSREAEDYCTREFADPQPDTGFLSGTAKVIRDLSPYVIESAELHGLHPGFLLTIIAVESTFDIFADANGHSRGVAQFSKPTATDYNLVYDAPIPRKRNGERNYEYVMSDPNYNRPDAWGRYPIWSPRGSILAMGKRFKDILNDPLRKLALRGVEGIDGARPEAHPYMETVFWQSVRENERLRVLYSIYNQNNRVFYSINEHFRQYGGLPATYIGIFGTPRLTEETVVDGRVVAPTPPGTLLGDIEANRRTVYRIVGLCGEEEQGLIQTYSNYFEKVYEDGVDPADPEAPFHWELVAQ